MLLQTTCVYTDKNCVPLSIFYPESRSLEYVNTAVYNYILYIMLVSSYYISLGHSATLYL